MKQDQVGIFFDRDGTINTEVDFLRNPDELELIPKSAQAIREANELGIKVFVITNQSGIARGFLTEDDLSAVHSKLKELLKPHRAHVDAIYYCPHHPELGNPPYNIRCHCRKPDTGMLRKAEREFHIDLRKSFVVGDRCVDVKAGLNAGCTPFLVLTGYGKTEQRECRETAGTHHTADDAYDAWLHIKKILKQRAAHPQSSSMAR